MSGLCERCGIGQRPPGGICDWCAAPLRPRLPFWTSARRRLLRSWVTARLREKGPIVTGIVVGAALHLLVAAAGVLLDVPSLWRMGFLWDAQWWWALVPEPAQPWLFAPLRGAAYGALAGLACQWSRPRASPHHLITSSPHHLISPQPALVTALTAFLLTGWDAFAGTQHQLVAAAIGATVGRLTTLVMRGQDWEPDREAASERR